MAPEVSQYQLAILPAALVSAFVFKYLFEHIIKKLFAKTKTKVDDAIINSLKTPVFWTIIIAGTSVFLTTLKLPGETSKYSQNTLLTIATVYWTLALLSIAKVVFVQIEKAHGKFSDVVPFLQNLTKIFIIIISALFVLDFWGIDITPFLASAGVLGVAIAFAAKDTVANLFGGMSVFFDKPYKTGDYVIIEDKYRGEVINIGMRSTKIRTRDNVLLTVPNSVMVTSALINETGFDPSLRVRLPLGVAYESDLESVEKALIGVMKKHKKVQTDPPPKVRFRGFEESSIKLEVLFVVEPPAVKGIVKHELIKSIHKEFGNQKIVMPYPHMDVHIRKEKG